MKMNTENKNILEQMHSFNKSDLSGFIRNPSGREHF